MTRIADPDAVRHASIELPAYLRFHTASGIAAGIERPGAGPPAGDAERRAVADPGKHYGSRPYDRPLVPGSAAAEISLDAALEARRSRRSFADRPVSFECISTVLATYRCTGELRTADTTLPLRTAASAGGLYPIEVYLAATRVAGLPSGVYHYRPADAALATTRPALAGELADALSASVLDGEQARGASGAIMLTVRFSRSTDKYGDRGYRYALIEAGGVMQALALGAAAAHLGIVCHGAFYDRAADRLLGLDGSSEAVVAVMLFGALARSYTPRRGHRAAQPTSGT